MLDGIDQTIFQSMGYDLPGYQGYDKAMDVFYLCIAYLATMRNWLSDPAFQVARFLYFYRLVGVLAFELTQWRPLLLVFPNTFEYFFIAYEVIRLRWQPTRYDRRFWIGAAALIWIVVKLPQEWWIHIAQLDFTDTLETVPWFGPAIVVALLAALAVFWRVVRPRLDPVDWSWRVTPDPLPAEMDEARERGAWMATYGRVWSTATLEKVVLVGLIRSSTRRSSRAERIRCRPLRRLGRLRPHQHRADPLGRTERTDRRVAGGGVRRAGGREQRAGARRRVAPAPR